MCPYGKEPSCKIIKLISQLFQADIYDTFGIFFQVKACTREKKHAKDLLLLCFSVFHGTLVFCDSTVLL